MNRIAKQVSKSAMADSRDLRSFTASAKLTQEEFAQVEQRATRAGKRVGDWCREVFLRELSHQELPDILLAEVLGIRMIVLNLLGPLARGAEVSAEEFQKLIATIDSMKMKRAQERIAEMRAAGEGA